MGFDLSEEESNNVFKKFKTIAEQKNRFKLEISRCWEKGLIPTSPPRHLWVMSTALTG